MPTIVYSTIIAYDTTKLNPGPTTIADLFDLQKFPGKRALQKNPFVNLEWALIADGVPALRDRRAREAWLSVMEPAYTDFCGQVDADRPVSIDPYAAESIDEFFAVTSEAFFVDPDGLHQAMPQVYRLLTSYFGQDPRSARFDASLTPMSG